MPWVTRGLRNGILTTPYPKRPDGYGANWRGAVNAPGDVAGKTVVAQELCPTGAIGPGATGDLSLDRGKCILCGRCVAELPEVFSFDSSVEVASLTRPGLVVPLTEESETALAAVRQQLSRRVRALRRSVHVRHVDAGSDGAEEWEITALLGPSTTCTASVSSSPPARVTPTSSWSPVRARPAWPGRCSPPTRPCPTPGSWWLWGLTPSVAGP